MGGFTNNYPVADLNRPTLLIPKGATSGGLLNNGPGVLYVSNKPYFAWNDGNSVIPIPVGGSFAADGSDNLYGMPAPYSTVVPYLVQTTGPVNLSMSGSFPKAVTPGNCIVVAIIAYNGTSGDTPSVTGVTIGGISDNFSQAISKVSAFSTDYALAALWTDFSAAGGQELLNIAGTNLLAGSIAFQGFEIGNLFAGSLDKSDSGTGTTSPWSSGATAVTSSANQAWFGVVANLGPPIVGPAAPWINNISASPAYAFGYQFTTAEAAATYNGTSGAGVWAAVVATLKQQTFSAGSAVPAYVSLLSGSLTSPP